ncbi:MAG TPA: L-2-hydroxyglutarate oxidase [Gaiellaceae bacterium]|nr:L-2-hydroxyglutarate oxidase [Gaiellaceae bacterium]
MTAPERSDLVVVGAGILGLATARELALRHPDRSVVVLDKEPAVAGHQTGHNSGVVHAGIYYTPGSLKARLCVAGARELYEFCDENGIAVERCGKVIVALHEGELPALDELERRGRANGARGLRRLDRAALADLEPHVEGVSALHSPDTGIVDFVAVAGALRSELETAGGRVALGCEVTGIEPRARRVRIAHSRGETEAAHAVFCAGAWSDRLAVLAGASPEPRIVPFRGAYLRLEPERRSLVRSLVYPVPDPRLPFLGVHLTRRIDGEVLVGPTALLAGARDAYRLSRLRARDVRETLAWPGTPRLVRRYWRTGLTELRHAVSRRALVAAARAFVPELNPDDVRPAFAGIRAQALGRDGRLVDDFVFSETERALHVRNAPSPGATSSLAIARHIADRAEEAFDLARWSVNPRAGAKTT